MTETPSSGSRHSWKRPWNESHLNHTHEYDVGFQHAKTLAVESNEHITSAIDVISTRCHAEGRTAGAGVA